MADYKVNGGQDNWDVVLQKFGQVDNIFDFLTDNPSLNINSALSSGQDLAIDAVDKGNIKVKTFFTNRVFIVMNADAVTLSTTAGDYNNDYNNDYLNT